jgi:hypothetical protein
LRSRVRPECQSSDLSRSLTAAIVARVAVNAAMLTVSDVADMGSYWPRRVAQEQEGQPPIVSWLTYPVSASGRDLSVQLLLCVEGLTELRVDSGHTQLDTPLSHGVLVHGHCTQLCHTHAAKSYQRPRVIGVNARRWGQSSPAAKHSTNTLSNLRNTHQATTFQGLCCKECLAETASVID